jgi:hypothetical protein
VVGGQERSKRVSLNTGEAARLAVGGALVVAGIVLWLRGHWLIGFSAFHHP